MWAADVERRRNKTRGMTEREKKLKAKKVAAAADEQARLVSMNFFQPCVGQFPGPWPTQGTIGSPSTFSPASPATAMFQDTYAAGDDTRRQERPVSGADFEAKMRRAFNMYADDNDGQTFNMYADDNDGQTFKYLNVFPRIEECEKWKEVRKNLANNKGEQTI
ncbi:hypothetical protein QYE76_027547 [Lolium multiflorum]|uniref:Uncharacterized protein n=1 Tax=Lolium multiflorum TaxID=4521 RepID=A0AAD8VF14_LOLMU|nr:hypothetical protein QYE76_027547 [Lolium multiflorum]